jgi:pimeloyl-ACP methyl ester carboxylesterase
VIILIISIVATTAAVIVGIGFLIARVVMHPPSEAHPGIAVGGSDVILETADGLCLAASLFAGPRSDSPGIVAVHGGTNNRADFLALVPYLSHAGFTTLLLDLRGHGSRDDGRGITLGVDEQHDVMAAVHYLRDLGCRRVGAIGASLGASSCLLAADADDSIDALVLQSVGYDLAALLVNAVPKPLRRLVPIYARILLWKIGVPFASAARLRYPQPTAAARLRQSVPALFIHGEVDEVVDLGQARHLRNLVPGPTELWVMKEGGHDLRQEMLNDSYASGITDFFVHTLQPHA